MKGGKQMAATTSIRVDVQLAKSKLQAKLDAHNKAFADYNKAVERYETDLDKWALKVKNSKDATKVSVSSYRGDSITVEVPQSMMDIKPVQPKEIDFPGILNHRGGYGNVSDVEAIENALGILDIAVDSVINVNAIKGVGSFLK
jgi:hypothetical protein